jgi:hypothetical protein
MAGKTMIDVKMLDTIFASYGKDTTYQIETAWRQVLLNDDARSDALRWLICTDPIVHCAVGILASEGVCDEAAQNEALVLMLSRHIRQMLPAVGLVHHPAETLDSESGSQTVF